MNDNDLLKKQFDSAPIEIRKFVVEKKWVSAVEDIIRKNNFSSEQKTALENEILFVLISLDLLNNLETNLTTSLSIEPVLAKAISEELKERVFAETKSFLPLELEQETEREETQLVVETSIQKNPPAPKTTAVEIPPTNLPMIEPGEVVHDTKPQMVPPVVKTEPATPPQPTIKPSTPTPPKPVNNHYPNGQDPYREPLE